MVIAADLAHNASAEALVPGDHDGIVAIADYLRAHSVVLDEASGSLSRVEVTGWRGTASTAFQAAFEVEPGRWAGAARAFDDAATAMSGYAASLGPAREVAERARQLYNAYSGMLSTASSQANLREQRSRYLGGTLVGPPPAAPPAMGLFDDGEAQREQARALLAQARSTVLAAGNIAADALSTAMAQAPEARRFYEETIRPPGAEESTHTALDVAGMTPVVGFVPDLVNAGWYGSEGRSLDAGLSLASAVPGIGDTIGAGVITAKVSSRLAASSLRRIAPLVRSAHDVRLGRPVTPLPLPAVKPGQLLDRVPYGFASRAEFQRFSATVHAELRAAGIEDATVYIRGSAMSGIRFRTGESIALNGPGDLDLAVVSPSLLAQGKDLGVSLRGGGTRTEPIDGLMGRRLGVSGLDELSSSSGASATIMVYGSKESLLSRGDAILLP